MIALFPQCGFNMGLASSEEAKDGLFLRNRQGV